MNISISALTYLLSLIIGELVFLYKMPRRDKFFLRLLVYFTLYPAAVYGMSKLAILFVENVNAGFVTHLFELGFFAVIFSLSMPVAYFCWEISWRDAFYFCIAGYSLEHICNILIGFVSYIIAQCGITLPYVFRTIVIYLIIKNLIITLLYFFMLRPVLSQSRIDTSDNRIILVSAVNLAICMVLSSIKGYGMGAPTNSFTTTIICGLYALFGCSLCLGLQMGVFKENSLKADNATLEHLLRDEVKKHELSKDNIDLINMKYHDLKYQLGKLDKGTEDGTKEILDEIYESFAVYDSIVKTGNEIFDIIVMNIYPLCIKNSIQFTYIVDGEALNILKPSDISSLFGNLLDNAMESLMKEPEYKRIMSLNVHKEKQMLVIHLHNECSTSPDFEDNLPITTKEDKRYHGYGVRSIRYLINKYNGEVRMSWQDNVFSVDIVI